MNDCGWNVCKQIINEVLSKKISVTNLKKIFNFSNLLTLYNIRVILNFFNLTIECFSVETNYIKIIKRQLKQNLKILVYSKKEKAQIGHFEYLFNNKLYIDFINHLKSDLKYEQIIFVFIKHKKNNEFNNSNLKLAFIFKNIYYTF